MTSPALTQTGIEAIYSALQSHAMTTGIFDRVNDHEARNPTGRGLYYSVIMGPITPIRSSGLNSTSGRVEFTGRAGIPGMELPAHSVDPQILYASLQMMAAYAGDFQLSVLAAQGLTGLVRMIDLRGAYGTSLEMTPGWLLREDGGKDRVADITIPVIMNDLFAEAP